MNTIFHRDHTGATTIDAAAGQDWAAAAKFLGPWNSQPLRVAVRARCA
jgi:hypothetical protein